MLSTFVQYPSELWELSQVAWKGVEEGKILFMKEDVPETILQLLVKSGLFSQVRQRVLYLKLECHMFFLIKLIIMFWCSTAIRKINVLFVKTQSKKLKVVVKYWHCILLYIQA